MSVLWEYWGESAFGLQLGSRRLNRAQHALSQLVRRLVPVRL